MAKLLGDMPEQPIAIELLNPKLRNSTLTYKVKNNMAQALRKGKYQNIRLFIDADMLVIPKMNCHPGGCWGIPC